MTHTPRRAGIYCRLSYSPDGNLESVERQEADCRRLGDRLAWPISERHVLADNNRSAWQRNRKRPGWDALLAAIEAGEIDAVIVYHGDRLIRQPYDLEKLISIADSKGVRIASVSGTRNLDNPDDRFILRIEAAQACKSSDDTSRRVRRAGDDRVAAGRPRPGGKRGFGFERDNMTHIPAEVELIREAARRLLAGETHYGIVKWLNQCSTTTMGQPWNPSSFKEMMQQPRLAGLLPAGHGLVRGAWDPVLDRQDWEDVQAALARKTQMFQMPSMVYARKYLLSGIALCVGCETGLTVARPGRPRTQQPRTVYRCRTDGCTTRVTRSQAHLDAFVEGRVLAALNDGELIAGLIGEGVPETAGQIAALERRRDEARRQLENLADLPEVDAGLVARSLAGFERRIVELREVRVAGERQRLLARMAGISREEWQGTAIDVRAATVRALFRVTVLPTRPGRGFREEDVRVEPV